MANNIDEMNPADSLPQGRETKVSATVVPAKMDFSLTLIHVLIWLIPIIIGVFIALLGYNAGMPDGITAIIIGIVVAVLPGIIYEIKLTKAGNTLLQMEQKLQHDSSQIDNYLEQRVIVLKNCARLIEKSIDLDKSSFTDIAKLRSGNVDKVTAENRNDIAQTLGKVSREVNVAFENYPDLRAHEQLESAINQNAYFQKEITAAREVYNDAVLAWNRKIFEWPVFKTAAAKRGYTTRIPFAASEEVKAEAKDVLF